MNNRLKIKTIGGVTGTEQTSEMSFNEMASQNLLKQTGCFLQANRLQELHQASLDTGLMDDLTRIIDLWVEGEHQQFQIKESAMDDEELDFLDEILSQ